MDDNKYSAFSAKDNFSKCDIKRNLISFWFLGLCNNFAYVVMLSAAYDILSINEQHSECPSTTTIAPISTENPQTEATTNGSCKLIPKCNIVSTGAILLADVLPTLVIKLTAPFYMQRIPYHLRVAIIVIFSTASFPIVSTSQTVWLSILGVVCASIGSGFGEITFLSLSAHYENNVISAWSSGTGMAGVAGALSYTGFTAIGISPRNTLFILLVVPLLMLFCYYVLLVKAITLSDNASSEDSDEQRRLIEIDNSGQNEDQVVEIVDNSDITQIKVPIKRKLIWKEKFWTIIPLLKYMIPLGLVYFAEYFINQALFELLLFPDIWLPFSQQYRWYQVIYQVGVLVSRSSVNLLHIKKIWILTIFQFINVAVLLCQIFFNFIPSIWIVFIIVFWEGLLGGSGYVNTFYNINEEEPDLSKREFSQGVASVADSTGITIAGFVAIPVHNWICGLYTPC